jgi:hypothetical protein
VPWIPIKSADKLLSSQILKLPEGKVLRVESFKGDRWFEVKRNGEEFEFSEHGYRNAVFKVKKEEVKETVKRIIEVEFPRSHQLRVSLSS